jgi:hypothetical protein
MNITDGLFILCCILSLLIIIVLVIFSVIEFKKESAIKNPYYWCDGDWTCCNTTNCNANKSKALDPKVDNAYFPADRVKQGSAYHQNCILPIQNAMLNYTNNQDFDFGYIYALTGNTGANNPSVYAPGCTGPGVAGGTGYCDNPAINPLVTIGSHSCGYASFDSPPAGNIGSGYTPGNSLVTGHQGYNFGGTLLQSNWVGSGNSATPYIAGISSVNTTPGNNFNFPYTNVSGAYKGQYTGGPGNSFAGGNTQRNTFQELGSYPTS